MLDDARDEFRKQRTRDIRRNVGNELGWYLKHEVLGVVEKAVFIRDAIVQCRSLDGFSG